MLDAGTDAPIKPLRHCAAWSIITALTKGLHRQGPEGAATQSLGRDLRADLGQSGVIDSLGFIGVVRGHGC
jgi:hypothetical protein